MAQTAVNLVYQDFEPFFEWQEDEGSATLIVMLPGFTKEQLRVQVTSTPVVRINGERRIIENTRRRFAKEFSIPPYCDTNDVSAKFEGGILTIKFPKLITPASKPQPQQAPMPQKEKEPTQDQYKPELPQKEKEPSSDEKEESPLKEKEQISDDKERDNKTEDVEPKEVAQKKVETNGVLETVQEGTTSKIQEKPKAKMIQRLKTRVLDFTVSLGSTEDHDVMKGFGGIKCAKLIKRPKIWMNIIVAILLVIVLGVYVKNAFRSSQEGSKFEEF